MAATAPSSAESWQKDPFTATGGAQTLQLSYTPMPNSMNFKINGVSQDEGTDYTISGNTLSLLAVASAAAGDWLEAHYTYLTSAPNPPSEPAGTLRGSSSAQASASSVTISAPSGLQVGDFMFMCAATNSAANVGLPAGWTAIDANIVGGGTSGAIVIGTTAYKVATSADIGASYTVTGTLRLAVAIVAYVGINTTSPINAHANSPGSGQANSWNTPTITTTAPDVVVVSCWATVGPTGFTVGSGYTVEASVTNPGGTANPVGVTIGDEVQTSAGTSTARTLTATGTGWVSFAVGLTPA